MNEEIRNGNRTVIYILLDAVDEIGPFFQNFYSLKNDKHEAIDDIMRFSELCGYTNVVIAEIEYRENFEIGDSLYIDEDFDGYIQDLKMGYPEVDNDDEEDDDIGDFEY